MRGRERREKERKRRGGTASDGREQGRAKGPAVWGGAARPVTQAADASRGGGEAGVGRKEQQVGNGRAIDPIVQQGPL